MADARASEAPPPAKRARQDAACPQCNKVFSCTSARNKHVREVHEARKPFSCPSPGCTYAATTKQSLDRHVRAVHEGRKPFPCQHPGCTYAAARKPDLKHHVMSVHEGKKPFSCSFPGCTYAAATKQHLNTHAMFRHTGERPHACPEPGCGMQFVTNYELKTHVKSYHTPEGIQKKKKQEERWMKKLIQSGYTMDAANDDSAPLPGHFRREFKISFSCVQDGAGSYARIDFVICPIGGPPNVLVFMEIDEHQHRFYTGGVACDVKRIGRVHEALALGSLGFGGVDGVRITWLRYNPNDYTINEVPQKLHKRERERILLRRLGAIGESAATDRSGDLEAIEYFCFSADAHDADRPLACEDPSFADYLKSVVRRTERVVPSAGASDR